MAKHYVVMVGAHNRSVLHGPFRDRWGAEQYAKRWAGVYPTSVVPLHAPNFFEPAPGPDEDEEV